MIATAEQVLFSIGLALVATTYAAVGQGGATGYIAVMGIFGFSPDVIRPAALTLNIVVSAIGTAQFARAGLLKWRTFYPFALLGLPCSILGGLYRPVVGAFLLLAALQMALSARRASDDDGEAAERPPFSASVLAGAGIGFAAGLTGIGGGILLAPLLLTFRWADARHTAAISAGFNLLNSAAALTGLWLQHPSFPLPSAWWIVAVVCGGLFGSWLGVRGLPTWVLHYALAALLIVASLRILLT